MAVNAILASLHFRGFGKTGGIYHYSRVWYINVELDETYLMDLTLLGILPDLYLFDCFWYISKLTWTRKHVQMC